MKHTQLSALLGVACLLGAGLSPALGVITFVSHLDIAGHCDTLSVPSPVDELGENSSGIPGSPGFPADEYIDAEFVSLGGPSCLASNGGGVDLVIAITNLTGRNFVELWYVADVGTTITNFDGVVSQIPPGSDALPTFRIDALGSNRPLVSESIDTNGVFEIGETWEFILQDYSSIIAPDLLRSVGLGFNSPLPPADAPSSGSILARVQPVPEPARALLSLLALGVVLARRQRR